MPNLPYHVEGENAQAAYHVVPDPVKGGWNVYNTNEPQEPQRHFSRKEEAVNYAEQLSLQKGIGFVVAEHEAPEIGR